MKNTKCFFPNLLLKILVRRLPKVALDAPIGRIAAPRFKLLFFQPLVEKKLVSKRERPPVIGFRSTRFAPAPRALIGAALRPTAFEPARKLPMATRSRTRTVFSPASPKARFFKPI